MAGGIQPVQSNPRSDYGGGSVGGGLLSSGKNRKKDKGGKGSGTSEDTADPPVLKRGGKVRKTGMALVHKGERMLTAKQDKKRRSKGRSGRKGRAKSR